MSKEVGGMVGSKRVKGAVSARTEGARRASGVGADGAAVGAGGVPGMLDSLEVQVLCPGLVETKG